MAEQQDDSTKLEVRTYFVRGRDVLVARADFGELYVDYYLHQGTHGCQHAPFHDGLMKESLAAVTLHLASRPWNESCAWTIHFQHPLVNLFVCGDNRRGAVTGQIFAENVKDTGANLFVADTLRDRFEPRRSSTEFDGVSVLRAVERYYATSEQLPAKIFQLGPEDFAMVCAHPDYDEAWFQQLDLAQMLELDAKEELSLLEKRSYEWRCGCDEKRMLQVLGPLMRRDAEELFAGEPTLRMSCPRCGARYIVTREAMEAYVSEEK